MNLSSDAFVKFLSLLLTALMRVPSIARSSRPKRSRRRHKTVNSRKTDLNAARLSLLDRILDVDVIVDRLGQKQLLRAIRARNVCHARF